MSIFLKTKIIFYFFYATHFTLLFTPVLTLLFYFLPSDLGLQRYGFLFAFVKCFVKNFTIIF
jgi:hypothetical protein